MVNIQYGGRHSTNLIDDVISPAVLKRAAGDRTGLNNFRPFEELGLNLRQAYANPGNNTRNISIRQIYSSSPVDVNWIHQKIAAFTYVPPVSSFASIGYANNGLDVSEKIKNYFENLNLTLSRGFSKVALLISVYLVSPVLAFSSKGKAILFSRDYKLGQAKKTFPSITVPTFVKTSLVVATIGLCSVLFVRGISDPGAGPSATEGANGTTTIRNDSNRKSETAPATTPSLTEPSSTQQTAPSTNPATQSSGRTWDVTPQSTGGSSSGSGSSSNWTQQTTPVASPSSDTSAPTNSTTPSENSNPTEPAPAPAPVLPTLPTIPTVTEPTIIPTNPLLINDPILSQPLLP